MTRSRKAAEASKAFYADLLKCSDCGVLGDVVAVQNPKGKTVTRRCPRCGKTWTRE